MKSILGVALTTSKKFITLNKELLEPMSNQSPQTHLLNSRFSKKLDLGSRGATDGGNLEKHRLVKTMGVCNYKRADLETNLG